MLVVCSIDLPSLSCDGERLRLSLDYLGHPLLFHFVSSHALGLLRRWVGLIVAAPRLLPRLRDAWRIPEQPARLLCARRSATPRAPEEAPPAAR